VDVQLCDVRGRPPTQKVGEPWTKYKQNANLGNSYTVVTKTSVKQIPWSDSVKYTENYYFKH